MAGEIYIWLVAPHPEAGQCVISWKNKHNLDKNVPLTALDSYIVPEKKIFWLFFADELGGVRI